LRSGNRTGKTADAMHKFGAFVDTPKWPPYTELYSRESSVLKIAPRLGLFLLDLFRRFPGTLEEILSPSKARILPRAALLGAGLSVFLSIPGFAQNAPATATVPTHEVIDEMGRTIRVAVNPIRIVSLAPSLTETMYALKAEDRLVGDTDFCDYPPDAQKKTKVGGMIDPSMEQIVALHPDLVLITKEANRLETVHALDNIGIPAYATNPHKVTEILTSTEKLADVLNVPDAGKAVADDLQKRLSALQTRLNGVPPRRVLFVVWTEPLISIGKATFVADAIGKAGAVSIVDSSQDWPQVSMEEVARQQPDYLIFAVAHTGEGERNFETLANLPGWRILNAVRDRHFVVISDAIIRPAPRIVSAIEDLAHQLHAEVFAEPAVPEKVILPANSAYLVSLMARETQDSSSSAEGGAFVRVDPKETTLAELSGCASTSGDSVELACAH
jgi:iron complex transport system substrate-binding protein